MIKDDSYLSFNVIRSIFDQDLLENSKKAGAIVKEETKVVDVDLSGQGVVVSCKDKIGQKRDYEGKFLFDASGQNTFLAKKLNLKKPFDRVHKRISFATHWRGAKFTPSIKAGSIDIVQLGDDKPGWIWLNPLETDRLGVGLAISMDYMKARKKELAPTESNWQNAFYTQELMSTPRVKEVLDGAEPIMDIIVDGDSSYYTHQKYGRNYALIGDAHAFLDPIFASGIYLAMKSAELVAKSLILQLTQGDTHAIANTYKDIIGAYKVIEELIVTFYTPGSIKFNKLANLKEQEFKKYETAFALIHFLLAGDFFTKHERYLQAINMLKDETMVQKYRNLIGFRDNEKTASICQ